MTDAHAMIDVTCKQCRRRFGYRSCCSPRCYHCGSLHDSTEIDALMVELTAFEEQHDAHDAVMAAMKKAEPTGLQSKSVIRRVAYGIGADPEDVIAFVMKGKPLPAAELEQVRRWMKART